MDPVDQRIGRHSPPSEPLVAHSCSSALLAGPGSLRPNPPSFGSCLLTQQDGSCPDLVPLPTLLDVQERRYTVTPAAASDLSRSWGGKPGGLVGTWFYVRRHPKDLSILL